MSSKRKKSSLQSTINYISEIQRTGDSKCSTKLLGDRLNYCKSLHKKDLYSHYGCVNAVEFSNDGEWLVSGGDDKRVLLWNINNALSGLSKPKAMKGEHSSNIFCISFDGKNEKLFSAGNDEQVILHDIATANTSDVFLHDEAVYGISVDPVNHYLFASACDDGRILVWDSRASSTDAFSLANYDSAFHAVMHNPQEPRLIATANAKEGVGLWDIRKPHTCLLRYGSSIVKQSAMSVRFNSRGSHILSLRRRSPPVLYELHSPQPVAHFDHTEYYNSCTMKSCCFAGNNDEYVLSGSDDFKLYMWKIPDNISAKKGIWIKDAHAVLKGHRSIVNQVRYNYTYGILASSGVEKIIKLWSTFPMTVVESNYTIEADGLRRVYSHEEYINLVLESGQFMTHDYSHHSVLEDQRMMAFFDSLVQRDIEGWTSDSSETSATAIVNAKNTCFEVQSSLSSSDSTTDSSSSSDVERHFGQTIRQNFFQSNLSSILSLGERRRPSSDLTSDKISQLIAQKRKDLVKNAKSNRRLQRNFRNIKKQFKTRIHTNYSNTNDSAPHLQSVASVSSSDNRNGIEKRTFLRLRRAKLLKRCAIIDNSSDSDLDTGGPSQPHVSNGVVINLPSESCFNPIKNDIKNDENPIDNDKSLATSSLRNELATMNHDAKGTNDKDDLSVAQCSNSQTNHSISLDPAETVFFPQRKKKHSRNYRKRSADNDAEDDA